MGFKQEAELVKSMKWRYAVKKFDPARKIPPETWKALEDALVLTPSSYGLQPWRFLVITSQELREKLVPLSWNQRQVADCSHLVVFLAKTKIGPDDIDAWIKRLGEVRGTEAASLERFRKVVTSDLIEGPRAQFISEWAARQVYIALGNLMTSAALLSVDTCPMEGFVPAKFDEILGLAHSDWTTTVLCPCGYRSTDDRDAKLPKVRFDPPVIIEHI